MAGPRDITIQQGETWTEVWALTDANGVPVPLDGHTGTMTVRDTSGAVRLQLTQVGGSSGVISLGGSTGVIIPTAFPVATAVLPGGYYAWDYFDTDAAGFVTPLLAGTCTVLRTSKGVAP